MADWITTLFGGGGGGTTTPKDVTPPEFTDLRGGLAEWIKNALSGTVPGAGAAPTEFVAPTSQQFNDLVAQTGQAASGGSDVLRSAGTALTGILDQQPGGGANPFLQQMIDAATRPMTRAFEETVVPQLLSRFTGAGQQVQGSGSSAFAREARKAGTDLVTSIGDVTSQLSGAAYESDQNRRLQAVGQAAGLSNEEMSRLNTGLQATLLPQLVSDLGVQRGLEQYKTSLNALLQVLQVAAGLAQPHIGQAGRTQGTSSGIIPALFG